MMLGSFLGEGNISGWSNDISFVAHSVPVAISAGAAQGRQSPVSRDEAEHEDGRSVRRGTGFFRA